MSPRFFRILKRIALGVVGVFIFVYVSLFFLQDLLIFQSVKLPKDHVYQFEGRFNEYFIPVVNPDQTRDTLNALWFNADTLSRGLVIYFHGNRGNLQRWGNYAAPLIKEGYDVLMIDYRGYGKSTGKPGEEAFYRDARQVFDWALPKRTDGKLVLYGRSLGSAVASHLAGEVPNDLLILETPFDELKGVAQPYVESGTWLLPMRYTFSNRKNLEAVHARVVILHGTDDAIVPLSSALRLKPLLQSPEDFIIIPGGGHRNLPSFPQYEETLRRVLP